MLSPITFTRSRFDGLPYAASKSSKISGIQFVGTSTPAFIYLGCSGVDQRAMRIENAESSRFIGPHARLNSFEGFLVHEKRGLHRAVMTPEPHGAQRRVVGAATIWKIKRHVPGAAPSPQTLTFRASLFRKRAFHEGASHDYELVLPFLLREWFPTKRGTRTATPPARP
jgi:hypothetical protein